MQRGYSDDAVESDEMNNTANRMSANPTPVPGANLAPPHGILRGRSGSRARERSPSIMNLKSYEDQQDPAQGELIVQRPIASK